MFDLPTLTLCAVLPAWACSSTLLLASAVFVLLQVLDVWSTHRALAAGGQEANPIARWFMAQLGAGLGLFVLKAVVCLYLWWLLPQMPAHQVLWVMWVNNLIYVAVVAHNLRVARRMATQATTRTASSQGSRS